MTTAPLIWEWVAPWLGRSWVLTDPASPVTKLRGATGAGFAPVEHWWRDAPLVPGSSWDGYRVGRGQVYLPLMVRAADSGAFMVEHAAFLESLDPARTGTLRVTRVDGSWREIACRYETGADFAIDLDPVAACRARYGITWATENPFWAGEPIVRYFPYSTGGTPGFPGPGWSPAPGSSLSVAAVDNPGSVASYPVWRVDGPFTSFSVGIGDAVVQMTATRAAGEWVEIDMTPGVYTMLDQAGTDMGDFVTEVVFEPIPPGESSLVTVINGAGVGSAVTLSFAPRYRSAF